MNLIRVVYASRATVRFSAQGLEHLAGEAAANNARLGVTGLLIYGDGNFLQILEGVANIVDELYAKIERDTRHESPTVILREPITGPAFGKWNMGVANLAERRALDPYPLQAMTSLAKKLNIANTGTFAVSLVQQFREQLGVQRAAA